MAEAVQNSPFIFIGNQPTLDFINTEVIAQGERVSLIESYANFAAWLEGAQLVEAGALRDVEMQWDEGKKQETVESALRLRATLRSIVEAFATNRPISTDALDALNALLRRPTQYAQIETLESGYARRVYTEWKQPADLLALIAESAADLLCDVNPTLVRKCENPACILYFYDNSKNHARRWCSMSGCGNRHKVAMHYQRVRSAAEAQPTEPQTRTQQTK